MSIYRTRTPWRRRILVAAGGTTGVVALIAAGLLLGMCALGVIAALAGGRA